MSDEPTDAADLGDVVRVFRPRPWWAGFTVFTLVTAGLIGLRQAVTLDSDSPLVPLSALVIAACGGFATLCGMMAAAALRHRVVVHENGLVVCSLWRARTVWWEDVDEVYFNMKSLLLGREASVRTRDKVKVGLPGMVTGLFALSGLICDKIRSRVRKELRRALAAGQTVPFGKELGVSSTGLTVKRKTYRWAHVTRVEWTAQNYTPGNMFAVRSVLCVETSTRTEVLRTADIPNVPILLKLLESDYGVKVARGTRMF